MFAVRDRIQLKDSEPEPAGGSPWFLIDDNSDCEEEIVGLPYEEGLFHPHLNPDGHRKYSNKFLRAVSKSMKDELDERRRKVPYPTEVLPYEPDQYSPSNPKGNKRYSIKFLKAVGEMVTPDEQQPEFWRLLAGRSVFPWDLLVPKLKSRQKLKCEEESADSERLASKFQAAVSVDCPRRFKLQSDKDLQH